MALAYPEHCASPYTSAPQAVFAYNPKDYALLKERVTAERVKEHFKGMVKGEVVRYELPNIHALNFVMYAALGGGVTRSLSVDMHGKGLSSYLLDMELCLPELRDLRQQLSCCQ